MDTMVTMTVFEAVGCGYIVWASEEHRAFVTFNGGLMFLVWPEAHDGRFWNTDVWSTMDEMGNESFKDVCEYVRRHMEEYFVEDENE